MGNGGLDGGGTSKGKHRTGIQKRLVLCQQVSMVVWPCPALAKCGPASHKHQAGLAEEQDRRPVGGTYIYVYVICAYCAYWEYMLNLTISWTWGHGDVADTSGRLPGSATLGRHHLCAGFTQMSTLHLTSK